MTAKAMMSEVKKSKVARGPKAFPVVGNFFQWRRNPLTFLESLRSYGTVSKFKLLWFDMFLVTDPALIEEVLIKTNEKDFAKTPPAKNTTTAKLFGDGLLTSMGDTWKRQRRLAQPAFHKQRIAGYADTMVAEAERLAATWQDGETRNIQHEMMQVTLRIVVKTLFGAELTGQEERTERALNQLMTAFGGMGNSIWLILQTFGVPTPAGKRYLQAVRELDAIVCELIAQRRAQGNANPSDDLLSMLLQAQDEDGSGMSDAQLRDEAITMFFAGHETTALALTWAFYLLATHPDKATLLQQELQAVLNGHVPTLEDLPALRYTDAVIKESMRLYPPAWMVDGRIAVQETMLGGYRIPKGGIIGMSQWVTHRDPAYFANPTAFVPERWLDGSLNGLPKYAYFPFGGGQRQCIGNTFAAMEAVLILATVARTFTMIKGWKGEPTLDPAMTLRPRGGLNLKIRAHEPISR
jgi:cytochrome P450